MIKLLYIFPFRIIVVVDTETVVAGVQVVEVAGTTRVLMAVNKVHGQARTRWVRIKAH